jgi:hypothetical protein
MSWIESLGEEVGGEPRQEFNGGGPGLGGEPGPDLGRRDDEIDRWFLQPHKDISPDETRSVGTPG